MKRSLLILLFVTALLHADKYKLGSGVKIPKLPLYVGGYITADYISRHDDYNRFRINDLALITYGNYQRFSYLWEFEIRDSYLREWGKRDSEKTNNHISTERLYVDYSYSDNVAFRLGKFNTPVGYWNMTPISVLRDSASNPYSSFKKGILAYL